MAAATGILRCGITIGKLVITARYLQIRDDTHDNIDDTGLRTLLRPDRFTHTCKYGHTSQGVTPGTAV